jgi:hypothetical protein
MIKKQIKLKSRSVPFRKQIPASPWLSGVSHPGRVCNYMRLLTLAFLLIAGSVTAQTKGDNLIIVNGVNFRDAMISTLNAGYQIADKDESMGTFSTAAKTEKHGSSRIIHVRIKDSIAYITGDFNLNMSFGTFIRVEPTYEPIVWKGWKTGAYRLNFVLMENLAKAFGGEIKYGTQ